MTPLTPRQRQVLEILIRTTEEGCQFTKREMCRELGFRSTNAIDEFLDAIERKGHIRRGTATIASRSVVILRNPDGSDYLSPIERLDMLSRALGCAGRPFLEVLAVARTRRAA